MVPERNQFDREAVAGSRSADLLNVVAKVYLARGWPLIPLLGKQPGLATWKEYQTRLPTTADLALWFGFTSPKPTGIGIVTGRLSGLVVVDCDSPNDAAFWLGRFPRSPLMVQTGRGGMHIYYHTPSMEVRNRAKLFQRQIDIRGEGGYVAAPPSQHPNGVSYAWTEPSVDLHTTLPAFDPLWLVDTERLEVPRAAHVGTTTLRNVAAYIGRIAATAGQGGHNATFRAACKLRDAGLSPDDALVILSRWNDTNAFPPWSPEELQHKIASAYQAGGQRDSGLSSYR